MKRFTMLALAAALSTAWVATSHAEAYFTARLTAAQETPGVASGALGTAHFTLTSAGLQFYVTAEGLTGMITSADISDAPPGMPGPIVRDITSEFAGTHSAAGLWTSGDAMPLTGSMVSELMAGNLYVNIHTPPFGPGEIRGQIQLSDGAHFTANLQGPQVNPPVFVPGTGTGSFTLTEEGLQYKITLNGLVGGPLTTADLKIGAIGLNGPVVFPLAPTFVGNSASGFIPGFPPGARKSLLMGEVYLDITDPGFPTGELRGQVELSGGFGFSIKIDAGQEVPPGASPALGSATATLTASGLVLDLTVNGLVGGPIMAADLHHGPAGVVGPIVRDIMPDFVSPTTAHVVWRADDPGFPLSRALVSELLQNKIYVNLYNAAFPPPMGEIRGQLVLNTPGPMTATSSARLTGMQVEPPVPTPALGTATFQLGPAGLGFRATFDGLSGPLGPVEIHDSAIGTSGPIERIIAGAELIGPNTVSGTWSPGDPMPFTPAMLTELFKGNLYMLVKTGPFPGGEIRGQMVPGSGAEFESRMTGFQEVPPVPPPGLATGSFRLTANGVAFNITADGLTGPITSANIAMGARGVTGPAVRIFLGPEFVSANTLAGIWKPIDAMPLTPALITEILKGNLYVTLATAAFPSGEVRGQITLSGGDPHESRPVGMQEVPPVVSMGKGIVAATLTDEGFLFRMTTNDMTSTPSSGGIQHAPAGLSGPMVRPIYPGESVGPQTVDAVWKTTDADPLTTPLMGELFNEHLYMNVMTTAFPTGEIRGQFDNWLSPVAVLDPPTSGSRLELRNAPNPVREHGTDISFYLPKRTDVKLAIYDVTGAQVARISEGAREAGWHHVAWSANGVESGMYFAKLDAGAASVERKLLVMR
jgi:hypothetical protein